jgi:hypothetical protein
MPKSKLSAFLSLLLVFLSGAAVGALAHKLYVVDTVVGRNVGKRPNLEEVKKRHVAEMREKVKLDDAQTARFAEILDETAHDWRPLREKQDADGRAIHERQVAKIKAMLRPDQLLLYEKLQAERDAERKRGQQGDFKK